MIQTQMMKHYAQIHTQVKITSAIQNKDTHKTTDAFFEIDDTSKVRHDSNIQFDTSSAASTEEEFPTDQIEANIQDATFSRHGKYNLRPYPNQNFSDSYKY